MDKLKEFTSLTIQSGDVSYADVAFETYDEGCSGPFWKPQGRVSFHVLSLSTPCVRMR